MAGEHVMFGTSLLPSIVSSRTNNKLPPSGYRTQHHKNNPVMFMFNFLSDSVIVVI